MRFISFKKQAELIQLRLTTIDTQVTDISSSETLSDQQISKLKILATTANQKYNEFEKILNKLFGTTPLPEDMDDKVIGQLQEAISDLNVSIQSNFNAVVPSAVTHTESENLNNSQVSTAAPATAINLPKLNLPRFTGQPDRWIVFHSLFENTIHKNESISNVEKFSYLLSCLGDEALGLVKSLPVTSANYHVAWQTLTKRYHNSRLLITLHLNNLLDLHISNNPSVKQLRQFLSTYNENCQALLALGNDVTQSSLVLTAHILRKFGSDIRSKFEHSRNNSKDMPTIIEFTDFLEKECSQLEAASLPSISQMSFSHETVNSKRSNVSQSKNTFPKLNKLAMLTSNNQLLCSYCSLPDHTIYRCSDFLSQTVSSRHNFVKERNLCINCFGNHKLSDCKSTRNCSTCNKRHHSMLHFDKAGHRDRNNTPFSSNAKNVTRPSVVATSYPPAPPAPSSSADFAGISRNYNNTVLLATAVVVISAPDSCKRFVVRAVLDSAAQTTFITEKCANTLQLRRSNGDNLLINGVSASQVHTKGFSHVTLASLNGSTVAVNHPVVILGKITNDLPSAKVDPQLKLKLKNFVLADPTFDTPSHIDMLIGADLFAMCLQGAPLSLGDGMPSAIDTVFGFVIIGTASLLTMNISDYVSNNNSVTLLTTNDLDIHASMQRFWSIEEPPNLPKSSPEDNQCEEHFISTHTRNNKGRYVCRLPFKSDPSVLGDSSKIAKNMLLSLERKFEKSLEHKQKYVEFMSEYLESEHMILTSIPLSKPHYIIPHHGVYKDGKLRVVFNASAPSSSNVSLNSILHQGPKLQNKITDIILRFRMHKYVFSCDIKQMFRQINIHEYDQCYQLVYWRKDPSQPVKIYQLTTVTYGMTSSPYLANRVIQQLIHDEGHDHPLASQALRQQLYVDDALLGTETEEDLMELKEDVTQLLYKGGFELRKWTSNSKALISSVPEGHREKPLLFHTPEQPCYSILGLKWIPADDEFSYTISVPNERVTKRSVLSCIAKIYDPSGWLTPVIVWSKGLMQHIWTLGLQWDDTLPHDLNKKWLQFISELPLLETLKIPRYLGISSPKHAQLHGFADASETAYAACVYLREENYSGTVSVYLLIAKSRVAPLKRVTLPRLELCAALLLAKLINYCSKQLSDRLNVISMNAWSDSTIALSWIHTPSYRLKTFVANRVAEIQELTPSSIWSHVGSSQNPADCSSRGIYPNELISHPLWWTGPSWLKLPPQQWPNAQFPKIEEELLPDIKPQRADALAVTEVHGSTFTLTERFSSWTKLVHVTAYVIRFIQCLKTKRKISGNLSLQEIDKTSTAIYRLVQKESFTEEIARLKRNKECSPRIQRLTPFLDNQDIIRVGGRLKNAPIVTSAKHPVLLPKRHHVVDLIVDYWHKTHLHTGPQSLQAMLAQHYWIISARSVIRSRIFKCLKCFRAKPKIIAPLMGDLPLGRVTPNRVFSTSGTDFAGPFKIKLHTLRRIQPVKVYLCLFICFATKAVHIEVVTDLSADAFMAALIRFSSRRGRINHLHCDCGTNFVGAAATLRRCFKNLLDSPALQNFALDNQISFHFLPPHAPHQGGLWERAVKSAKHHLQRVIGTQILSYEEFVTLTARTEAMLNSRPITPLSSDPSDLEPLTPGHFFAGGPLTSIIEPQLGDIPNNRLKRWQLVQSFSQQIWKRWLHEYLHTLQQRSKWTSPKENLKPGDLVLIHDNNTPPLYWKTGRITGVSPGADGVVRVVHLKTSGGNYSRPAVKVSRLPIE